jgi:regulatory protein
MKPRLSLKGRGLQLLSQREHSRTELWRKLLAHAKAAEALQTATGGEAVADPVDPQLAVEAVIDWLQANRYFSEERFVESRIHARAPRFGNLRIQRELAQHGVTLDSGAAQRLKDTETSRAREVWSRKFDRPPVDAAERAKQARFLAGRGFSGDVIRQMVQGLEDAAGND